VAESPLAARRRDCFSSKTDNGQAREAREQFGNAASKLNEARSSDERDAGLTDLALAEVKLGGPKEQATKGVRLSWEDTQKLLVAALNPIQDPEARREAVRAVCQRLIERDETKRVWSLVNQVYSELNDEKAATLSVVGIELHKAGKTAEANRAADSALELFVKKKAANEKPKDEEKKEEKRPRLRAEVVALAILLDKQKQIPKLDKNAEEEEQDNARPIGEVEGLARKGDWDQAKAKVFAVPDGKNRFLALLALAAAAVDDNSATASEYVENAITAAKGLNGKPELSWPFLRLTKLALVAGLPEDRAQAVADGIAPSRSALRGRAQLAVFRAQLKKTQKPLEEDAANKIDANSLSRLLAAEDLARHNTRRGTSWADKVKAWQQPRQAFGALGVALGIQDRSER
jgi:hypothetical protein